MILQQIYSGNYRPTPNFVRITRVL